MTPPDFRWTLSPERAWVRICLEGELDLSTAATFHDAVSALIEDGWTSIVVDLSGLSFMDSSGLRATFELDGEATRRGVTLRLTGASDQVQRLFAMTGLSRQLDMAPGTNGHRRDG
jgi:anti-sigma B factor antagonist